MGPKMVAHVIPAVTIATNSRNVTLDGIRMADKSTCPENAIIATPHTG
jgi:hypothetical protein